MAKGAHLVTGTVCQKRAREAVISYSPSKRRCPYSSKKQSEKVNTFFFQLRVHSEIQTYLCQTITRSDRGPNLSVQKKMRQIFFTPGNGFSTV